MFGKSSYSSSPMKLSSSPLLIERMSKGKCFLCPSAETRSVPLNALLHSRSFESTFPITISDLLSEEQLAPKFSLNSFGKSSYSSLAVIFELSFNAFNPLVWLATAGAGLVDEFLALDTTDDIEDRSSFIFDLMFSNGDSPLP